jgi:uncharacterized protein (TIGR03067 family)
MLVVSSASAKDVAVDKATSDELKKFQGTWMMVSGEADGTAVPEEHVKQNKITFVDNKVEIFSPHQNKEVMVSKVLKIDTTKTPHELQWSRETGPKAGIIMKAIYEFEGPDKYKVCFDPAGKSVPKAFSTKKGSGHYWHVWKRSK